MRILHVLTEPRGGGGRYAMTLARATRARGADARFAAPRPLGGGFETVALRRFPAAANDADLIHYHGIRSSLLQWLTRHTPGVITPHGLHGLERPGLDRAAARRLTRISLGHASGVICVSADELRAVQALAPKIAPRARLIRNGVTPVAMPSEEDRQAARRQIGLRTDDRVLLFVGALNYQKNPQLAIDAARVALEHVPQLVLLVAGEGRVGARLRGASGAVRLLGQRDDVRRLLVACDAVLNSSRWEGLSLALLEALWHGRPLIVTDVRGNRDAAGDAGLVVPPDVESLARAIRELFDTHGLLESLGMKARRRAEQLFDEREMIEATLALYDEIAASGI